MLGTGGSMNVPISIGGAANPPCYAIPADDSGVLAFPLEDVGDLARLAIDRQNDYSADHTLRAGEKQVI